MLKTKFVNWIFKKFNRKNIDYPSKTRRKLKEHYDRIHYYRKQIKRRKRCPFDPSTDLYMIKVCERNIIENKIKIMKIKSEFTFKDGISENNTSQ